MAEREKRDSQRIYELRADICRALAHPRRLERLHLLDQGERSVSQLAAQVGSSLANISQHVAILRDMGWL